MASVDTGTRPGGGGITSPRDGATADLTRCENKNRPLGGLFQDFEDRFNGERSRNRIGPAVLGLPLKENNISRD